MSDMVLDAAALEDQEALLTDDLFEKDDSAYSDADKMTRPSLSWPLRRSARRTRRGRRP